MKKDLVDPETDTAPQARDGRNIDQLMGALRGEGAQQRTEFLRPPHEAPIKPREESSYYGLPVLKEAPWRWYVPAYFYVGGLAGASAAVGAAAMLRGSSLRSLTTAARWMAVSGAAVSGALLIADLGRPSRFVYMMRVFRPSSPMNMGTWILSAFSASAGLGLIFPPAAALTGILGLPLAGYTAVLVSNTAVPLWLGASTTLPALFLGSAATAAGSFFELLPLPRAAQRVARRVSIGGKVAELLAGVVVEHGPSAAPLRRNPLWTASKVLTAASLFFTAFTRKRRLAGALGSLGSLALRFAIVQAGKASARDPHATFEQQRAALTA